MPEATNPGAWAQAGDFILSKWGIIAVLLLGYVFQWVVIFKLLKRGK